MSVIETEKVEQGVTVEVILLRAADILEEFGWCQGHLAEDEKGYVHSIGGDARPARYCALGAIIQASCDLLGSNEFSEEELGLFAEERLKHFLHEPVPSWNDDYGRTKEEVVATLRRAGGAA